MIVFDPSTAENPFEKRVPVLPDAASQRQRELAEKYTRISHVIVDGEPNATHVWLVSGVQQFLVGDYADTPEDSGWSCWVLAKALETILDGGRKEA